MKQLSNKRIALISCILIIALLAGSICLRFLSNADNDSNATVNKNSDYANITRDTSISVDSNGVLQINRTNHEKDIPVGKENTWTLFIYLTGSNLESQHECASKDIKEILDANITAENIQNLNIIVQTGGSNTWHSNNISNEKLQRYKVDASADKFTLVEELDNASMGSPDTLYNFLDWGVTNYPAEHMGVIFWNHGSGVARGVCMDELYDKDTLTVHELEYVLAKLNKKMTSKFEMLGFDTCLSGSLEYANILAPYAKYMVASADVEPGAGWHHTEGINYLLNNPDATGAELGKVICDAYGDYYDNYSKEKNYPIDYTLSTYDLSKVDNACIESNYLTKYLYDKVASNENEYWTLSGFRSSRLIYSTNNVDIGSIIDYFDNSSKYSYNTSNYKKAIDDLIIYSRMCDKYANKKAKAITLYLPSQILTMHELNNYRNVCFSPYLLKYIEWMNVRTLASNMNNYTPVAWEVSPFFYEKNFNYINYDSHIGQIADTDINANHHINDTVNNMLCSNPDYNADGFPSLWYKNIKNNSAPPVDDDIYLPQFDPTKEASDKYNISSSVAKENINKVKSVYSTIFTKLDNSLICLGENNKVSFDAKTGKIQSNFTGEWFMLPDGQLLTTYIISEEGNSTIYSFPVMIGDIESSIRVQETIANNGKTTYTTLGVWDANDNKNTKEKISRSYIPLKVGTTITPIYDVFDFNSDTYESEYGEEYTISSDFDFLFGKLNDGEYSFAYEIEQLNHTFTYSDLKEFSIKDNKVSVK